VLNAPGEIWYNVSQALRLGLRGLPGDSSLALLLAEHRSVPYKYALPHLSVPGILGWADAYHRATGEWPTRRSGFIENAQTTWLAVDTALNKGNRGLPGGSSLARLLKENGRT
jgi:hypothetical protein